MNKLTVATVCVLTSLSLSGCSWLNTDKKALKDYRKARLDQDLQLPAGMNANKISDYYAIPPVRVGLVDQDAEVPEPPALSLADEGNLVRIQKFSGNSWILVQLVPGQVWPLVMQYASENGMVITREQAGQGFLETGWLIKQDNNSLREKYRFIVKQGVQRNSTEIDVLQVEQPQESTRTNPVWGTKPIDEASADVTMRSMAQYLASYADPTAAVSLRAQNIDTSPRISLKADGNPRILVNMSEEKGFASARFSIAKSDFDVADIDISKGELYATSKLKQKGKRKISRLLGLSRKTIWPNHNYTFTVKQSAQADWIVISVDSDKGLNNKEKKEILKQVKRNFS